MKRQHGDGTAPLDLFVGEGDGCADTAVYLGLGNLQYITLEVVVAGIRLADVEKFPQIFHCRFEPSGISVLHQ